MGLGDPYLCNACSLCCIWLTLSDAHAHATCNMHAHAYAHAHAHAHMHMWLQVMGLDDSFLNATRRRQ